MSTAPNPSVMARLKKPAAVSREEDLLNQIFGIAADTQPEHKARVVRPGPVHTGVIKAKELKEGMEVRSWLHDRPCGSKKVVATAERIDDGAQISVTYSSAHAPAVYKAAYRFYCEALVQEPGFVPYFEEA